jgi:hypothetical protein
VAPRRGRDGGGGGGAPPEASVLLRGEAGAPVSDYRKIFVGLPREYIIIEKRGGRSFIVLDDDGFALIGKRLRQLNRKLK